MFDIAKKVIGVLVILVLGAAGYKYYVVSDYLDNEANKALAERGAVIKYGTISPFPIMGATIHDVSFSVVGSEETPVAKIGQIVINNFKDNDTTDFFEFTMYDAVLNYNQMDSVMKSENSSTFAALQSSSEMGAYIFAPVFFYATDGFDKELSTSEAKEAKYAQQHINSLYVFGDYNKDTERLAFELSIDVENYYVLDMSYDVWFDKAAMKSFSPASIMRAVKIVEGSMSYQDDGFFELYNGYLMNNRDLEGKPMSEWLLNTFHAELAENEVDMWPDLKGAIETFIANPTGLGMTFKPQKPFMIRDFQHYKPWDIPAVLEARLEVLPAVD